MASEMEKILGKPLGRNNVTPGTIAIPGKEFVYFQDDGEKPVRKQFNDLTQYTNPPHAKSGAVTSQGCSISLPDNTVFHGIAYHGDIDGWRKDIEEGAKGLQILLARIDGDNFIVSDGKTFQLADCKVSFG